MSEKNTANFPQLVSREQSGNAIGKALRLYVGRGRQYSVKQLSNGTGIKDRVIECAMCAPDTVDYRPLPNDALLSIALFLGADFTNEWLCLAQQGAFLLADGDPDPGELAADNSDDNATIVRAAIDGEFCPDERRDLKQVGSRMVSRGATLVALSARRAA